MDYYGVPLPDTLVQHTTMLTRQLIYYVYPYNPLLTPGRVYATNYGDVQPVFILNKST